MSKSWNASSCIESIILIYNYSNKLKIIKFKNDKYIKIIIF